MKILSPSGISNIIINVLFISTFVTLFFFTYAKKIEGEIVEKQVNYLVDELTDSTINIMPKSIKNAARDKIVSAELPNLEELDKQVETDNKKLLQKALIVLAIVLVIGFSVVGFIKFKYSDDVQLKQLLFDNFIVLIFIALTEYLFLTLVGKNYISADPNFIRKTFIDTYLRI